MDWQPGVQFFYVLFVGFHVTVRLAQGHFPVFGQNDNTFEIWSSIVRPWFGHIMTITCIYSQEINFSVFFHVLFFGIHVTVKLALFWGTGRFSCFWPNWHNLSNLFQLTVSYNIHEYVSDIMRLFSRIFSNSFDAFSNSNNMVTIIHRQVLPCTRGAYRATSCLRDLRLWGKINKRPANLKIPEVS